MRPQTKPEQRREFYARHQAGETYVAIAKGAGVSRECVRYWCRRQRAGGDGCNQYQRGAKGLLSEFAPVVRYVILRLKLAHPRWGRNRLWFHLGQRSSLRGSKLPDEVQIGRYLHQWLRFRRPRKRQAAARERPDPPTEVHQQWQLDFKTDIELKDGTLVSMHTVRDPVGEACLTAHLFAHARVHQLPERVPFEQARTTVRLCAARWGTLPDEVQTDSESTLVSTGQDAFPSTFTLWLAGLGIRHRVIRSGRPTDNAEVERCHRTVHDYAVVGQEKYPLPQLQERVDHAIDELLAELPSRAEGCAGRPPLQAHPDLLQARHPFRPEHELAHFDLHRVDAYLATFVWSRKVGRTGQICIGGRHHYYSVGRAYAGHEVFVRFDPTDRHFVFYTDPDQLDHEIGRRPARHLTVEELTGLAAWPDGLLPQQLPLPFLEGVTF
jgi:transposase InsO family protein